MFLFTFQEDLKNSGLIPFYEDPDYGYNPGRLFELYLERLNPHNDRLFQRPCEVRKGKKGFRLHSLPKVWFENKAIGKNKIGDLLPNLCKAVGVPVVPNKCIRATGIRDAL